MANEIAGCGAGIFFPLVIFCVLIIYPHWFHELHLCIMSSQQWAAPENKQTLRNKPTHLTDQAFSHTKFEQRNSHQSDQGEGEKNKHT
jgi:hypothetical protein